MGHSSTASGDAILSFSGELVSETVAEFRSQAENALKGGERGIVLHLSEVTRLDSSGVGAIVFLHRRLVERGRSLRVIGLRDQPLELARLIRLDRALGFEEPADPIEEAPGLFARVAGLIWLQPRRAVGP